MSTTYFHMTLCFYSSHMYIKAVLHTDCHANTPPMVHMQNLHCLTNLDHHFFHPLTLSLFQLGKCEWERKLKREGCGRGKRSPARMEAAACWANVLFPLLHNTCPHSHTKHTLCPHGPARTRARPHSVPCSPEAEARRGMLWCGRTVSVTDVTQVLCGVTEKHFSCSS